MAEKNRKWVLSTRPKGTVERENFVWKEEPVPSRQLSDRAASHETARPQFATKITYSPIGRAV